MNPWISAAIAVGVGLILGTILSRMVRRAVSRVGNDAIASAAGPLSSLVFSGLFVVGLVVALGFVQPGALDTIPKDLVIFLPRLIAAIIVVIGGNVIASLVATAVGRALRGMGAAERVAPNVIRGVILAFSFILAAAQLGVDTTIINIAAAAILFGGALAMAMLVGFGGRDVASEMAAGRAWRSSLRPDDYIRAQNVSGVPIEGTVAEVHPTNIELVHEGRTYLVPNSELLNVVVERARAESDD